MYIATDTLSPDKKLLAKFKKRTQAYGEEISRTAALRDYKSPESALSVIQDTAYQSTIRRAVQKLGAVKHVILVGIGGSSLGTESIFAALKSDTSPTLTVLDTVDDEALLHCFAVLKKIKALTDLAIVVVSKSGTTTETLVNARSLLAFATRRFGEEMHTRCIFVGNPNTAFHVAAKKHKIQFVPMPESIGGRFSVFTAVGMVPLTLLGIDTRALLTGASEALAPAACAETAARAARIAAYGASHRSIINFFTFDARLREIGYWYRQLLAESIGKSQGKKGAPFHTPLMPIVSTAADLHSSAQLYLSGDTRIYTHFVLTEGATDFAETRSPHWIEGVLPLLEGKTRSDVRRAIQSGVRAAYLEAALPHHTSTLANHGAREVGALIATLMTEVMCIAHAYAIDAFDQPHVELYKQHTRALLTEKV
jgi:glucose-6-phosphate isomerase